MCVCVCLVHMLIYNWVCVPRYLFVHNGAFALGFKVLLVIQGLQEAVFSPKETQAQMASQGYQVVRGIGASLGLLGLRAIQALQDQKVHHSARLLPAVVTGVSSLCMHSKSCCTLTGEKGPPGPRGSQRPKGQIGIPGPWGRKGLTGPAGDTGEWQW